MSSSDYFILFAGKIALLRTAKLPFILTAKSGEECVEILQNCNQDTTDDLIDLLIESLACLNNKKRLLLFYHRSRLRVMLANQRDSKDICSYAITTILAAIDYTIRVSVDKANITSTPSHNDMFVSVLNFTSSTRTEIPFSKISNISKIQDTINVD